MYTYTDNLTLLENLNVRSVFKDGVFRRYELYPVEGYALHCPRSDMVIEDEQGNVIETIPYYTYGGASIIDENYDFDTNPDGYEAVLIEEGMTIFGVEEETEKM